jgi:hypothetical protein
MVAEKTNKWLKKKVEGADLQYVSEEEKPSFEGNLVIFISRLRAKLDENGLISHVHVG